MSLRCPFRHEEPRMEAVGGAFLMRRYIIFLAFVLLLPISVARAEEIPERIDGTVISVNAEKRILQVDFEHPATFEHSQMEFQVDPQAGFKDFKKLSDLKPGDLVSLDYLDYGTFLKAIYVIHIPQEKTYFTHQEIAGALVKIKSNQKNPDETQKN